MPIDQYVDALSLDLQMALPQIWGRSVQTIFIGGGTPSLFSGDAIDRLLSIIRSHTQLSPYAEITLEANPGALERKYLKDYKASGVNRISLGVQSFNDKHLQVLGRIHGAADAKAAISELKQYFDNFNLDLIYGIPNQTLDEVQQELECAVSFAPTHISYYNLTIEPNTYFHKHVPDNLPDNDLCYLMGEQIKVTLANHGYRRYETSAYAQSGYPARHNLNYWRFGDYLGIGAGAHSKLSFANKIIRTICEKQPQNYMDKVQTGKHLIESREVLATELPFEFALNAFRLIDGFSLSQFNHTCGLPVSQILPKLLEASNQGFIQIKGDWVIPTIKGQDFLNDLLGNFL